MTTSHTPTAAATYGRIVDPANRPDPYPLYAALTDAPIHRLGDHEWLVSGFAEIGALLRDPRMSVQDPAVEPDPNGPLGSDGRPFRSGFLSLDPPHHDALRGQVAHAFAERIVGLRPRIEELVDGLVDRIAADGAGQVDVVEQLAYPLPVSVICELLDVPRSEEPVFHSFAERLTRGLDPVDTLSETEIAELAVTRGQWRAYLMPMIAERVAHPGTDLISALLTGGPEVGPRSQDTDRMNGIELGVTLGLLLIAGHETTVNLIANGTLALLRSPAALAEFRAHPETAPELVEEVLRYDPPVQMTRRFATAPVRVAGQEVPSGDRLALLLAAGNRDPRRFAEPDRFVPGRPDPAHLAFGGGLHYCLGAALARMEAQVMLTAIARRFVAPRLVMDPPYRTNMILRGPSALQMAFDGVLP